MTVWYILVNVVCRCGCVSSITRASVGLPNFSLTHQPGVNDIQYKPHEMKSEISTGKQQHCKNTSHFSVYSTVKFLFPTSLFQARDLVDILDVKDRGFYYMILQ